MNKKGFSFIEIAVVLVVIGIILGLAFKGFTLIQGAKLKSDVQKISKITSAFKQYQASYNAIPGKRSGTKEVKSVDIYSDLIKDGAVVVSDFQVRSTPGKYFNFVGCTPSNKDKPDNVTWILMPMGFLTNDMGEYICLMENSVAPDTYNSANYSSVNKKMSLQDICYFELYADDRSELSGEGRLVNGESQHLSNVPCHKQPDLQANYVFRVY